MTSAPFDDESPTCFRCGFFTYETARNAPKVSCPECGREILDVTDSLSRTSIPSAILKFVPEPVARECTIVPFNESPAGLVVLTDITEPNDRETIEKLRFILNRKITCLHADAAAIRRAIDRHYGAA